MARKTYYDLLHLQPDAPVELIEAAYRILQRKYHPDNRETGDEEKSKALSEAFEILKDNEQRFLYNIERNLSLPDGLDERCLSPEAELEYEFKRKERADPYPDFMNSPQAAAGAKTKKRSPSLLQRFRHLVTQKRTAIDKKEKKWV